MWHWGLNQGGATCQASNFISWAISNPMYLILEVVVVGSHVSFDEILFYVIFEIIEFFSVNLFI